MKPTKAIILFAHGARDPSWAGPIHAVADALKQQAELRPQPVCVKVAFLEYLQPTLDESIRDLINEDIEEVTILPMFIATGSHLKKDLPASIELLRSEFPKLKVNLSSAVGEQAIVQEAIVKLALAI